ncbi:tumor necrosis factor receptor superfamily member 13C [Caloenas nicobarica]|uniref:tumor necrosis factor receptor superfamily member 13C n=1 Tax=Caloenas nicobarica TaxID=187106 RepID=UPI0032B77787
MRELGSRSHSDMSSSGKDAASCLSSQCFDTLTKLCVECSDLLKDHTTLSLLTPPASRPTAEPARAAPTSAQEPTLPSVNLPSTLLIFGVPAMVGFILVLAALWGFLACKVGRQRKKRKVMDKEAEANVDATGSLPGLGCQDTVMLEADAALAPALCLNLNGSLKMPGPPGKAGAKRRPCCQGDANGDIVLLSAVYPRHEECNHSFPLPATELGATALVTTKTTQNCTDEDRA